MAGIKENYGYMPDYMKEAEEQRRAAERQGMSMQDAYKAVEDPDVLERRVNTDRGLEMLPKVNAPVAQATTTAGQSAPVGYNPVQGRPLTIADIFAQSRREIEKEKTDAAKMAKFQALGQLSQTLFNPIGWGAAGATADVKAPDQRGYIDAFNRMNKYDDQLTALGQQEAQWNINEVLRQRQREEAIADQQRVAETNLRNKMKEMGMKFKYDKFMAGYKAGIDLDKLEKEYGLKFENEQQKHEWEMELKKIPTVHYTYSNSTKTDAAKDAKKEASRTVREIGRKMKSPQNAQEADIKDIIDTYKDDPEGAIEVITKNYPDWARAHGLVKNDAVPGDYEDLKPEVPHAEPKKESKTKKTADL